MQKIFRQIKKYRANILVLVTVIALSLSYEIANAQTDSSKIQSIYRIYEDSVKIRWAPTDPVSWEFLNKYGYKIKRKTIMRDGKILRSPVEKFLTGDTLKPEPVEVWEQYAEDDYVAIAAQAIYGETFEISSSLEDNGMMKVAQKVRDMENRFSYALFAADMSPLTARLSALMITDRNTDPKETYLYSIIPCVPDSIHSVDTGYVYAEPEKFDPLPKPSDVKADCRDRKVMIQWDHYPSQRHYSAYFLERSDDEGKTFKRTHENPLAVTDDNKDMFHHWMFKSDSLPENNRTYFYRVRGITPFGETGPPSDTIEGSGYKRLRISPVIEKMVTINNSVVSVEWSFPDTLENHIKGFHVLRSATDDGPYKAVNKEILTPGQRHYEDTKPLSANYYKVEVVGGADQKLTSMPHFEELRDSVPPRPPKGLSADVDTNGVVKLTWAQNSEQDLSGYKVYRSPFKSHEFYEITRDIHKDTTYTDTINIQTLTDKVYYKIIALDGHFNRSAYSDVLQVERPDKIPPVSPVFKSYKSLPHGIKLTWANSSSRDADKHLLYRNSGRSEEWELIAKFRAEDSTNTYTDTSTAKNNEYQYTLVAVDDNDLESQPAQPVKVKQFDEKISPPVKNVDYSIDREERLILLEWEYEYNGVKKFHIYRSRGDEPLRLFKSIPGDEFRYVDKQTNLDENYVYKIRAVFTNNTKSKFSGEVLVEF